MCRKIASRRLAFLRLAFVIFAIAAGCQPPEELELRIGILADMDGLAGEPTVRAAQLAIDELQDHTIVLGGRSCAVSLVVEDTQYTPEGATRAALELINRQQATVLIGSSYSRLALPAAEIAEAAGVPMISPAASHPEITAGKSFIFRAIFVDSFQGRVMAHFARQRLGATTAAVLFDVTDSYSHGLAEIFRQVFTAKGGEIVSFVDYTTGESNYLEQLESIAVTQPEVLFLPNLNSHVLGQARQAREHEIGAILLGTDAWLPEGLVNEPLLEGAYFTQPWHPDLAERRPAARRFRNTYQDIYGEPPDSIAALTYDAISLLLESARRAGTLDPETLRHELSVIEGFPGITGTISYRGTLGDPRKPIEVAQIRDGQVALAEIIEPEDSALYAEIPKP